MRLDPALVERVRSRLVRTGDPPTAAHVSAAVRADGALVGEQTLRELVAAVRAELTGAGPLTALLLEVGVTDVLVNGADEVWVDRGAGLERAEITFPDAEAVRRLAQRLASSAGRRLDAAQPTVDARLADGVRLHAVLPPICPTGPVISLRVPRRRGFTMNELASRGFMTAPMRRILGQIVHGRLAFLVTGGTGTGKTTLLSTLLGEAAPGERIVLVEENGELQPAHPHVVRLEARPPNVEGAGEIDLRHLVRSALRMRPDRLVVGEVRGGEVVDLLAALNTGHEGGCGTVHANSAELLPTRLEALALAAGLGRDALHSQLAAAIQVAVHLTRGQDGRRRVAAVGVLNRAASGLTEVQAALTVAEDGGTREGPGAERLAHLLSGAGGARAAVLVMSASALAGSW